MRHLIVFLMVLAPAVAGAQDHTFGISGGSGSSGDSITTTVDLTIDGDGVTAFQFGVCHDPDVVSIDAADIDSAALLDDMNDGDGPDFASVVVGDDHWNAVVFFDFTDPDGTLDSGGAIYEATYSLDSVGTSYLDICGAGLIPGPDSGSAVVVLDANGDDFAAAGDFGALHVLGDWSFTVEDVESIYDPDTGEGDDVAVSVCFAQDDSESADNGGFQCALESDDTHVELTDVQPAGPLADLNDGDGPFFFDTDIATDGCTVLCIYTLDSDVSIDFTGDCVGVLELTYALVSDALIGDDGPVEVPVRFDTSIEELPNTILVEGDDVPVTLFDGVITLSTSMLNGFIRGDASGNGNYFPLLDALYILENGFTGGPVPPCLDAADADDNGNYFPLLDALYVLENGFTGGPAPPAPHPDCGTDPDGDEDGITCDVAGDGC